MSDYQAVYDAIRSRFHSPDIEGIARQCFDISFQVEHVKQEWIYAAHEQARPSVLFKPKLYPDGNMWCALYGENLMEGIAGFGATPDAAMRDFDEKWRKQPAAEEGGA